MPDGQRPLQLRRRAPAPAAPPVEPTPAVVVPPGREGQLRRPDSPAPTATPSQPQASPTPAPARTRPTPPAADRPQPQPERRVPAAQARPAPADAEPPRRRVSAIGVGLAVVVVAVGAGVATLAVVADDDDESATDHDAVAEVVVAQLPPGYVAAEPVDNDVRYELTLPAAAFPADRYVVTIYRQREPDEDDELWTGFDEDTHQAVYARAEGLTVRVSHQGPTAQSVAELRGIARELATDPAVVALVRSGD